MDSQCYKIIHRATKATFTVMFVAFSISYLSDYFKGALTTNYESIPIENSNNLIPSVAICVPYNGLYFDIRDFTNTAKNIVRSKEIVYLRNTTRPPAVVTIRSKLESTHNQKIKKWMREDTFKRGQCFRSKVPGGTNRLVIKLKTPNTYKDGSTDMKFRIFLYNPQDFRDSREKEFITVKTSSHKTYRTDVQNILLHPKMQHLNDPCKLVPQNGSVYDTCWTNFINDYALKTFQCYLLSDNRKEREDFSICNITMQNKVKFAATKALKDLATCTQICSFYHIKYNDVTTRNEEMAIPRVRVHFPDFLIRIQSSRKVGFTDVIGNVGGNLGLWLGSSLLDLVQVFRFFTKERFKDCVT